MKQFFKALGFAILTVVSYLIVNVIVTMGFGIVVAVQHAEELSAAADPMMTAELVTVEIGKFTPYIVIISAILSIGVFFILFLFRKDKFIESVGFRNIEIKDAVLIGAFGVFLNMVIVAGLDFVTNNLPLDDQMEAYGKIVEGLFSGNYFFVFLAVVIAAPIFEEIMVRGIIFNDLRKVSPLWLALFIQAFIFGLIHGNWIQGTYAFILGVFLGIVYHKYNSVNAAIIVHLTFNVTSTIGGLIPGFEDNIALMGIVGLIGAIAMAVLAYRNYDKERYELPEVVEEEIMNVENVAEAANVTETAAEAANVTETAKVAEAEMVEMVVDSEGE